MTSKADQRRYDKLHEIGCIACRIAKNPTPCGVLEIHHLVDNGYRALSGGNQATLPLARWHHRGVPLDDTTNKSMREIYGPSMFHESKRFRATYGSQRELLAMVNALILEPLLEGVPS